MSDALASAPTTLPIAETDVPALLPMVTTISEPRVSVESISIAAAVFALVQCLLWSGVPSELLWAAVIGLAMNRRALRDRGHDLLFARQRRARRSA